MEIEYERLKKEADPKLKETQEKFLRLTQPKNEHIKEKTDIYHEWVKSQVGVDNQNELRQKIFENTYVYKELRVQTRMLMVFNVVCVIILFLSTLRTPYFDDAAYGGIVGTLIALLFVYQLYYAWDLWIRDTVNFDEYDFTHYGKASSYPHTKEDGRRPEPGCIERIGSQAVNKFFIDNYFSGIAF